jgi:hypothetical protein
VAGFVELVTEDPVNSFGSFRLGLDLGSKTWTKSTPGVGGDDGGSGLARGVDKILTAFWVCCVGQSSRFSFSLNYDSHLPQKSYSTSQNPPHTPTYIFTPTPIPERILIYAQEHKSSSTGDPLSPRHQPFSSTRQSHPPSLVLPLPSLSPPFGSTTSAQPSRQIRCGIDRTS